MFSPTQMRAVAEKVYPERQWLLSEERGVHYIVSIDIEKNEFWRRFDPSLTGTDMQQANALQCIVAASKMDKDVQINCFKGASYWLGWDGEDGLRHATPGYDDILTASIAALLASTPSTVENV